MAETVQLINASAHCLPMLADNSVHMVATSPPYWGLRRYDGEQAVDWPAVDYASMPGLPALSIPAMNCGMGEEPTPEAFIGHLILVMREMWRVLRDDGTAWVNLGDRYARNGGTDRKVSTSAQVGSTRNTLVQMGDRTSKAPVGLKEKDLCGIPWRFALAAQADGWYLRSDIIWAKLNPMPESVTDRPTKAHEYVFLLAKSERYFYDAEAIKEPTSPETFARALRGVGDSHKNVNGAPGQTKHTMAGARAHGEGYPVSPTRNRRTVWNVPVGNYKGAHFATWPIELVRPMILAGTSARGVCPICGAPWERMWERVAGDNESMDRPKKTAGMGSRTSTLSLSENGSKEWAERGGKSTTTGWQPTCECPPHDPIPATVLDPFNGSGTTGTVALDLGRAYIGVDISAKYVHGLAEERIGGTQIGMGL